VKVENIVASFGAGISGPAFFIRLRKKAKQIAGGSHIKNL